MNSGFFAIAPRLLLCSTGVLTTCPGKVAGTEGAKSPDAAAAGTAAAFATLAFPSRTVDNHHYRMFI